MYSKFQGANYRLFRVLIFAGTGLSGIVFLIYGLNIFGISQIIKKAFFYILLKAVCLLLETFFYIVSVLIPKTREELNVIYILLKTRFSENRYSGTFDLYSSHSVFYILVVYTAVVQLIGYLDIFNYIQANFTCSSF